MKKLLSFLVAGAIALGLMGCSGDLHDTVDPSTIPLSIALQSAPRLGAGGVPGAMNGWDNTTTWTTVNNDTCTYTYDFVATAETIEWKAITTAGNWNSGAWGGGDNEALSVPLDTKTALVYDGATGGKKNASTSGLKVNKVYTITLNYENGGYSATVTSSEKEKPVPFYLVGFFVSGSFNGGAADIDTVLHDPTVDTQTGYVTYKYDFDLSSNAGWDLSDATTQAAFGIRNATGDWKVKYTGANFKFGTDKDYVATTLGAADNNKITGLDNSKKYRLYVQTKPDGTVSYKVVVLNEKDLTVTVELLPDSLNGEEFYLRGGLNSWDKLDTYKAIVTANKLTYNWTYAYEEDKLNYEFEGKFSAGTDSVGKDGWGLQLAGKKDGDAANLKFSFNDNATTLKFYYIDETGTTDKVCTYYAIKQVIQATKVVMAITTDKTELELDGNIGTWGGVSSGKWSADGEEYSNDKLKVKVENGKITFYVSADYDITGKWTDSEKKPGTNFKLATGVGADKWFNIDFDTSVAIYTQNLTWENGIE